MKIPAEWLRALVRPLRRRNKQSFERIFERFRSVLDANNRSLEIMTEMGDVLGGDYIFDVQYVRQAYAGLSKSLGESLDAFSELSSGRYSKLRAVAAGIDEKIRSAIDEKGPQPQAYVLFPEEISPDLADAVGNKVARLAEIGRALKLPVPDGFAVTIRAFDAFLRHNRITERLFIAGSAGTLSDPLREEIYELVLHGEVPPDLRRELERAVRKLRSRCGGDCFLSIRSSAGEEDGEYSFAGQFRTVLNVPLDPDAVEKAYKKVIASVFSRKSAAYQEKMGFPIGSVKMAVGCMVMADAMASGVLYSRDPRGNGAAMIINAAWGLGPSVVEGAVDADQYMVSSNGTAAVLEERIGLKETMVVPAAGGGVAAVETPAGRKNARCLAHDRVLELARIGKTLENHFRSAQDVEWAIDRSGRVHILQSRPVRLPGTESPAVARPAPEGRVLLKNRGLVVRKGVAAGRVFIVKSPEDLDRVPAEAILVARRDSSNFVRVMPRISAIITDRGLLTSHMASLAREFRLPTVINAGDATKVLAHGAEITLSAGDEGITVHEGRVHHLPEYAAPDSGVMEDLFEFRKKRYLLRSMMSLNLVDPLRDDFVPEACRTVHDVLRFIHEKSVSALIEAAGYGLRPGRTVKLDLPVPAGIQVIDIGDGLASHNGKDHVGQEHVASIPLKALLEGMTVPGIWRSDAVALTVNDFLTSMFRIPDITADTAGGAGANIAVVSRDYVNLNLKFGYHFTMVDCYCSPTARNNHLYFRFAGGATDISKRSRRLQVIETILKDFGFDFKTKGDLIIARIANISRDDLVPILDRIGRLIAYTRQLDAMLQDDNDVEIYVKNFREGYYGPREGSKHV